MARTPSVTLKDVADTVSALVAKGEKPTIAKVREMLGNKGSPNTISKFLKELKTSGAGSSPAEPQAKAQAKAQPKPQQVESKKPSEFQVDDAQAGEITVEFEPDSHSKTELTQDQNQGHRSHQNNNKHSHGHKQRHQQNQQNRDQNNRDQNNAQGGQKQKPPKPQKFNRKTQPKMPVEMETDVYQTENLESLSQEQLVTKIRRLETILNKEQFRRESAESMAAEAKEYAETIKEQVGARISDVKESMDMVVANLEAQIKTAKKDAERDLCFYREHLAKANKKIQDLSSKG